ncbi:Crp/Fnr family transcriptional regulator [Moraxella marmotae]|uniref:Crp/Fnr family transcriptional regulator n=1 Tax=Moraxella marmotae TaxID=3344520 RepID=UPI0035F363A0
MKKLYDDQKAAYLKLLSQHPIFAAASHKKSLLSAVSIHHYPKNSLIYLQYSKVRYLYFLLDGTINCYRQQPNGQESLMTSFDSHQHGIKSVQMINENLPKGQSAASATGNQTSNPPTLAYSRYTLAAQDNCHQLTAKAAQSAYLALLPITELAKIFESAPLGVLFDWYGTQMQQQLATQFLLNDLLSLKTAQAKVAYYLLAYANDKGIVTANMSQKNLAGLLGIRPETLSRTFGMMVKQQIISINLAEYTILKPESLSTMIEQ